MLQKRIQEIRKESMKEKDFRKGVIALIMGKAKNSAIELKSDVTEEILLEAIEEELNENKDTLNEYQDKSASQDKIDEIKRNIEFLNTLLPEKISEEEIRKEIEACFNELNLTKEKKSIGKAKTYMIEKFGKKIDKKEIAKYIMSYIEEA